MRSEEEQDQESGRFKTGEREGSFLAAKGDPRQQLSAAPVAPPTPTTQRDLAEKLKLREWNIHCIGRGSECPIWVRVWS